MKKSLRKCKTESVVISVPQKCFQLKNKIMVRNHVNKTVCIFYTVLNTTNTFCRLWCIMAMQKWKDCFPYKPPIHLNWKGMLYIVVAGMGTDFKEKLWNLKGSGGVHPHPQEMSLSKDENLCNLRLSWGHFYGNKFNFFIGSTTDQVKAPTLQDFKWLIATLSTI